jgi:hypothetical protein
MDKKNLCFGTLPLNPWSMLATLLHLEACHKS